MDKRTLMAVVLSVVVITVGFMVQNALFPPPEQQTARQSGEQGTQQSDQSADSGEFQTTDPIEGEPDQGNTAGIESSGSEAEQAVAPEGAVLPVPADDISDETRTYRNDTVAVTFSPRGGTVTSYRLLDHEGAQGPVEMIQGSPEDPDAFDLHFGSEQWPEVDALFRYRSTTQANTVEFYRDFYVQGRQDAPFTIVKTYKFQPEEYLFELHVTIEHSVNEFIPLNFNDIAYTLGFGPQMGPEFTELDGRNEYRRYYAYADGGRSDHNPGSNGTTDVTERVDWAGIVGKYFTVIAIPDATDYGITYSTQPEPGVPEASKLFLSRPVIRSSANTDVFRFYVGPKVGRGLSSYNDADNNAWGLEGLQLNEALDSRFLLGWLENILKTVLNLIYQVVPNFGVAIIILVFIVKALMFPLTKKSYESTARMQELQPKIQELREKYKDNSQKMNQEMAALYKKEGVNPLGGCLPLLLQLPFFIAMFGLFNNHFDLRGATFIPGWVGDLSQPDTVAEFGFNIPFIGSELHLLPVIFLGTQLATSRLMQTSASSGTQMKIITYVLPTVFFFVLYNMPSGLMVYWISTNIITAAQQYYNTKIKRPQQKKAQEEQQQSQKARKAKPAKAK
jgi:YidC/Oxa1 family membrane protein insertase